MLKKYRVRDYDFKLIIMLIAITVVGILVIGSADRSYQSKQILGFVMGLFLMVVISLFDYSTFLNFYWIIYIGNLVLLLLVEFFGEKSNNATTLGFHCGNPVPAIRNGENFVDFILCTVYYET